MMNICKMCNILCSGPDQYQQHIVGAKHKKKIAEISVTRSDFKFSKCDDNLTSTASNLNITENNIFSGQNDQRPEVSLLQSYFCKVCNIPCSGFLPYQQHIQGKNHLKKESLQGRVHQGFPLASSTFEKPENHEASCNVTEFCTNKPFENKAKQVSELIGISNSETFNKYCDICQVFCSGILPYEQHIQGKSHRKQRDIYEAHQKSKSKHDSEPFITSDFTACSSSFIKQNESTENNMDVNEKMLYNIEKQVFESYHCKICEISCSGYLSCEQHLKGEKHRKRMLTYQGSISNSVSDISERLNNLQFPEKNREFATNTDENKMEQPSVSLKTVCQSKDDELKKLISNNFLENMLCTLCSVNSNSLTMCKQHISGEKHKKKISQWKLQNSHLIEKLEIGIELGSCDFKQDIPPLNITDENKVLNSTSNQLSGKLISSTPEKANKDLTDILKMVVFEPDDEITFEGNYFNIE